MFFFFGLNDMNKDAIILNLVSEWNKKSPNTLGRITIQKLCYFAEAIGVPLGYKFSVYQYGPYSQELYTHIDDMVSLGLIIDENLRNEQKSDKSSYLASETAKELMDSAREILDKEEEKIYFLVNYFKDKNPRELELFSTTHYYYAANKNFFQELDGDKLKNLTIKKVIEAKKDKFKPSEIHEAYCTLINTSQFN